MKMMNEDKWLKRWIPLLKEKTGDQLVLEIGCGWGWDTKVLTDAGFSVIGIDMSKKFLDQAKNLVPTAHFILQNMQQDFPGAIPYQVIIASLSMHYMPWSETVAMVEKVKGALDEDGVFLFRVNSVKDVNYGASGNPEIGHHYYEVDGKPKRFFDETDVRKLFFKGWEVLSIEEHTLRRFERPKIVWEVVATNKHN